MASSSVRHAAGSLLVVGLSGTELSGLERAWLKLVQPAGVILFRRNIADALQTRALLDVACSFCAPHAFRCVDVEGGTVDRLRDALAPMPSAQAVAAADRAQKERRAERASAASRKSTGNTGKSQQSLAFQHGELIAQGVRAFGFNVTLAPVLDLALPESAAVMGSRAAGSAADEVVVFARDFLQGLAAYGVAGCGKHFPGLGGGTLDSHVETPQIRRKLRELERDDLAPYRALASELPMVMVNHAAYPNTPSRDLPATASKFWITKILRERIGYKGLIFSDDMEMGGILKFMSMEEAAVETVRAGMDTMEICHSAELILRAYEALIAEAERSSAFRTLLLSRAREAGRKRARILEAGSSRALTARQFDTLRTKILSFRDKVVALSGDGTGPSSRTKTLVETA